MLLTLLLIHWLVSPTLTRAQPPTPPPLRLKVVVPLESSAPFDHRLTDLVQRFNDGQPRYRVELLRRGNAFQGLRTIIASRYAQDLPDLALVNEADLPTLSALRVLQPLPEKWITSKRVPPELMSEVRCEGRPCAIPFQRRFPVWYFNRELLFKLNQETEKIPTSWAGLSALSRKTKREGTPWGLAIPVSGEYVIPRWSALGLRFDATSSPAVATAEWARKIKEGKANWLPGTPDVEEASRQFIEQKAVVLLGSIEQANHLKANASFKLGAMLPAGDTPWYGTDFVVLTKTSRAAAGAREFLDFLYRPDTALALFKAAATMPVSRAYGEDAGWRQELDEWPLLKTAAKSTSSHRVKDFGLGRIPPQVRDEWAATTWRAVERGEPNDALKASLQKLLSTNQR